MKIKIKTILNVLVMLCIIGVTTVKTFGGIGKAQASLNYINNLIYNNFENKKYVYQSGENFHIPMRNASGALYSKSNNTRIVIIPNVTKGLHTKLYTDSHLGEFSRCELNLQAYTPSTKQQTELINSLKAWQLLNKPEFVINGNFFDVRPQYQKDSACSSPLGTYIDSKNFGPIKNFASTFTIPYAGKNALSNSEGKVWTALASYFMTEQEAPQIITPKNTEDNDVAKNMVYAKLVTGRIFTGVAGIRLLSPTFRSQLFDPGTRQTSRTAIGYVRNSDTLVLFQNNDYNNGYTLDMVQDFYRAINAESAIGLDGGSSSNILVKNSKAINWVGYSQHPSRCKEAYCSFAPNGNSLPMTPAWIGFSSF